MKVTDKDVQYVEDLANLELTGGPYQPADRVLFPI